LLWLWRRLNFNWLSLQKLLDVAVSFLPLVFARHFNVRDTHSAKDAFKVHRCRRYLHEKFVATVEKRGQKLPYIRFERWILAIQLGIGYNLPLQILDGDEIAVVIASIVRLWYF